MFSNMTMTKATVLALLFANSGTQGFKYELKSGNCPYKLGTIKSNVNPE